MVAGNWMNQDGLYIQYGTSKAVPTTGGDYVTYGELREIELTINLASLTTSPVIQANTTFVPTMFVEQVEVAVDVAALGGTSFSVGLVGLDRTTVASNTGFVNALVLASVDGAGEKTVLTGPPAAGGAGAYVGSNVPSVGYITALAAGTFTAGVVKVRVKYRNITLITQ